MLCSLFNVIITATIWVDVNLNNWVFVHLVCLQVNVTYSFNYTKNDEADAVKACAKLIKGRFDDISGGSGSLKGLETLKTIAPPGKAEITAAIGYTEADGFYCLDGKLLQDKTCGKSTEGASTLLGWNHM